MLVNERNKMNITDKELEKLKATKTVNEWNSTCNEIKKARAGNYPPDWFEKVIISGLISDAKNNWK